MAKKKEKETKPEVPQAEAAIITIVFDRVSGQMFHSLSGWLSAKELNDVLAVFELQVIRPAAIEEQAAAMVRLQQELKDTKPDE